MGEAEDRLRIRIQDAVYYASKSFWTTFQQRFPEIKGQTYFPRDKSEPWYRATDQAIYWWLKLNHPNPQLIEEIKKTLPPYEPGDIE